MNDFTKVAAVLAAMTMGGAAQAATIDFLTATNDGTTITTAEATIVAGPGTVLEIGDFIANAVCPLGGGGCNGAMTLTFGFDITGLMFDYGFGNPGDLAEISLFDAIGGLLGTALLNSDTGVATADLSAFTDVRSVFFDITDATGAGYAIGDIRYTAMAAIPLPATLPLLLAALGGLALSRRRRAG